MGHQILENLQVLARQPDNPVHIFQISRSGQVTGLHDECDRRIQPPTAKSNQIQNRVPHLRQLIKNAVLDNDGHHKEMDVTPLELGTDPFPAGDLF